MSPQESLYFADWLRIAEKDLRHARNLTTRRPKYLGEFGTD